MSEHIVSSFDADLENLRRIITQMGGIAEKMLTEGTVALVRRDAALAQSVVIADAQLDALQREVEELAILTIARRQPMAIDLRVNVWQRDGATDALYTSLFRELLTYMMEDPRNITFCTHLLFCAKNYERIGDHTTNIAETIHYLVTGRTIAAERPKNDRTPYETAEPGTERG